MFIDAISLVAEISLLPISIAIIAIMAVMAILLFALVLLTCSDHAFFTLSSPQVKVIRNKKDKLSKAIIAMLDAPQSLYLTITLVRTFIITCLVLLVSYFVNTFIVEELSFNKSFLLQTFLITCVLLLFGEAVPRIYAAHNGLRIVFFMAYPMKILRIILKPTYRFFENISIYADRRVKQNNLVSLEDLSDALDLDSFEEISDKEILSSIIRLQKTYVTEIMKSRVDIISAEISLDFGQITRLIRANNYSRIPVYIGTIDNIKGILYVKDLIPFLDKPANFKWQTLIRPPYYIPKTKKIDSLLEEFQKRHIHMALVVDEYGGTAGIVSLEDILEEIVGEIHEEDDDFLPDYLQISESTYFFEGKFLLKAFCKLFTIESEYFDPVRGDADTIAGLILEIKGDFPSLHEEIRYKNFIFRIESEDERRIKRIKVTNTQEPEIE